MSAGNRIIKKIHLSAKASGARRAGEAAVDMDSGDVMGDPRYLRQSSSLINEALQKGFDVLQMVDGSIITTGTKTVVYQYKWDNDKGKLVKTKPDAATKKALRASKMEDVEFDAEETEEA